MAGWQAFLDWFRGTGRHSPGQAQASGSRVHELLRQAVEQGLVPGVAIRVMHRGSCWLEQGYGLADLESKAPVSPGNTVFRIASISKPITATALARLVAAGRVGLDDPLGTYVPEFPHQGINLGQLAAHTAGIRGYRGREALLNRPMGIADSLELFREDPLLFAPGEGFHYNSFDFVLLSLAMERASGQPFDRLVQETVLEPLQMLQTAPDTPGSPRPGQAGFYSRGRQGFRPAAPVDTRYKLAGGGYLSTVGDICRLGEATLSGEVAPAGVLEPFLRTQHVAGSPTWYGLGWQASRDAAGRPFYGHIGNGIGGYGNFFVYPAQELVIAILTNCTGPGMQPVLDLVVEAIHLEIGPQGEGQPAEG